MKYLAILAILALPACSKSVHESRQGNGFNARFCRTMDAMNETLDKGNDFSIIPEAIRSPEGMPAFDPGYAQDWPGGFDGPVKG